MVVMRKKWYQFSLQLGHTRGFPQENYDTSTGLRMSLLAPKTETEKEKICTRGFKVKKMSHFTASH